MTNDETNSFFVKMSSASPREENSSSTNANNAANPRGKPRTRSNYHLESNPFEVSFSQPHTSPTIPALAPPSPRFRPGSRDGNADSKPKLPPIAAIASPAAATDFPWAFGTGNGDVNSLRSGPLSPAMLAGPAQYNSVQPAPASGANGQSHHGGGQGAFDVMRTGLTPDVSRTGLTPLIGGPTSFPPPSPNTAAFIAMVTNSQNGSNNGVAPPATITPGTFSAITGALLNGSGDGSSTSPTNSHHPHPLSVSHIPNGGVDANGDDAAHTAANGLFLLSQAHHELTKREEQQAAAARQQNNRGGTSPTASTRNNNNNNNGRNNNTSSAVLSTSTKRKNSAAEPSLPAKRARASTARAAASSRSNSRRKKSEDADSIDDDDDDDGDDDANGGGVSDDDELEAAARVGTISNSKGSHQAPAPKKPETEEEKRKNFLERNRQGKPFFLFIFLFLSSCCRARCSSSFAIALICNCHLLHIGSHHLS